MKNISKKKVNEIHPFVILIPVAFVVVALLFLCFQRERDKSAKQIYYESIHNIVEVKASSSREENYGTAVFIGKEGQLVTNAHVVTYKKNGIQRAYDKLQIRFATEDDYREVNLVKFDSDLDIAILQSLDEDIRSNGIQLGNSDLVDYGERVYSIGNSMNHGISISEGILSVSCIEIEYDGKVREVIQSDINITSGSSGGALLNSKGELIGITSFRVKDNMGEVVYGTGFSVPVNKVIEYIDG